MHKRKIAFILELAEDWLGGLNYYRNLLNIIYEYRDFLKVELVIIVATDCNKSLLEGFPDVDIIYTDLLKRNGLSYFISKSIEKLFNVVYAWERIFNQYNIEIVSHSDKALLARNVRHIYWIPDFQHKYLPQMFVKTEIDDRNALFAKSSKLADCVILSSYDALDDYKKYLSEYEDKGKVLQFVVPVKTTQYNKAKLLNKYSLPNKFFYIPNQFWKHKNHRIIIEALNYVRHKCLDIVVCCSGNTDDYRNKDYFKSLMEYRDQNDLQNNFIVLGKIPYNDVQALMIECKALINPSLFEGWNTMVEEAKSLGKRIILSDLVVHKEQNPKGGVYFDRYDYKDLARCMLEVWNESDNINTELSLGIQEDFELRKKVLVEQYADIINYVIRPAMKNQV